jgi:hypothetical protein
MRGSGLLSSSIYNYLELKGNFGTAWEELNLTANYWTVSVGSMEGGSEVYPRESVSEDGMLGGRRGGSCILGEEFDSQ